MTTDCVATSQDKIDKEFSKAVTKIQADCDGAVTPTLAYGGACVVQTDPTPSRRAERAASTNGRRAHPRATRSSARGGTALAKKITDVGDCVGGRQSRCKVNDYLIRNEKVRVVIQDVQRNLFGIGQFGGQIIDGDIVRSSGPDRDSFEEWALLAQHREHRALHLGRRHQRWVNGGPAIIRATGVDDLLDFVNPSSTIASFGFSLRRRPMTPTSRSR